MRMSLHSGGDAQEHGHRLVPSSHDALEAIELVETVDDDATHSSIDGRPQFCERLVVAVHDETSRFDAGRKRGVKLTAGGDVDAQPLLVDELRHGFAQERLGGVDRAVAKRLARFPTPRPQMGDVVGEERRTELRREPQRVTTTNHEVTGR